MTISIWRYSHLLLAISCSIFLTIAAGTGIILGIDAVRSPYPPYASKNVDTISLSVLIPRLQTKYMEVNSLVVEDHQFVTIKGLDNNGKEVNDYIDPTDASRIAGHKEKSSFIQSVTSLHRSLFLHELGRAFIGITSFLLVLSTISGIILIVKQQKSIKRFFASFSKEYFSQYYHVWLGRLSMVPILVIAISGTYLSLVRFNIIPEKRIEINAPKKAEEQPQQSVASFSLFRKIHLGQVHSIEFPFADDPDEYYKIKLKDKEILINQFNGKIVAEEQYSMVNLLNTISLNLHTGKSSIIWAIILTIASINILFFIYSGFVITFKRRRNKIQNKYKPTEAEYILLVGSENGTTIHFANSILHQLISHGKKTYLGELNKFDLDHYPNIKQLIIFSATFGLGDAPGNANKFLGKLEDTDYQDTLQYCIVGFGSTNYPDFCGYAKRILETIETKEWATPILPLHTVNDKSLEDFTNWVKAYSDFMQLPLITSPDYYSSASERTLYSFNVVHKSIANEGDNNFLIVLQPMDKISFHSGDLLAIYPESNEKERLYSIGKVGKNIQLVVKLHPHGLGSSFLYNLQKGDNFKAAIQQNNGFHLDRRRAPAILVSNGTGIAPFLGMLEENNTKIPVTLYAGFRKKEPLQEIIVQKLSLAKGNGRIKNFEIAYSREEGNMTKYVYDIIEKDVVDIIGILDAGGVMMICGSIAMQQEVVAKLQNLCPNYESYKLQNQIKSDCY